MIEIGYTLSSEEHAPTDLVRYATLAEEVGFSFAMVSDHFHPWIDRQGQSSFVWSVLGAISRETERLRVATGVTCPTFRIHPAIIAHAAATVAAMMPGRFMLGVGSGERLNEHILGDPWPPVPERLERLEEAIGLIRMLWSGELRSHRGRHYRVDNARLYTLPELPPPILVAAAGPQATELAARAGDGLVGLAPDRQMIERFVTAGGAEKPRYGQLHVCWAKSEREARRIAYEWWSNGALPGKLFTELALPSDIEQAASLASEEVVAGHVVCSPDPGPHLEAIEEFVAAGYTHVYLHQVGPDQEGFLRFCEHQLLPEVTTRFERVLSGPG